MFGFGLSSGLRALSVARLNIQTAGHNVANANTEGFSRQRVVQSAAYPFMTATGLQIGTGVQIDDISRVLDEGIERRLRLQLGMRGAADVDFRRLQELEGLLNEPGGGLANDFGELFGRISQLQTNPADRALRGGVIEAGSALAQNFNVIAGRIGDLGESAFTEVRGLVQAANDDLAAIAALNVQILSMEANGSSANDLRDERERHVKSVAEVLDTRTLERADGSIDLAVDGHLLVAGDRVSRLTAEKNADGTTRLGLQNANRALQPSGGRIAALLADDGNAGASALRRLDSLAYNMALEFNRLQTTGVPSSGPFRVLTSFYGSADGDGDGVKGDELLAEAGLEFPVQAGELFVSVTEKASGDLQRTRLKIDPNSMTLQQFAEALSAIDHLTATVEPTGRLRITAESGYGFDFGNRLDSAPDAFGSFGGAAPSLGSAAAGPFDLSTALATPPATFVATIDGTPHTVSLAANEFANAAAVTVDELVQAINADLTGAATAKNVGGRLVLRSDATGSGATLGLIDGTGSPLASLGLPVGTVRNGQDSAVAVQVSGLYQGSANGQLVFVADGDGEIGVTQGLTVSVYDAAGSKIGVLNVGRGEYGPGDIIEVADGVKVAFGPGAISRAGNDVFAVDTLADSDTSDVLVALGLNSFFHGSSAADLTVNPELLANSDGLAAGLAGAPGDASNLDRMLQLRERALTALDSQSIEDHYRSMVADLGFETASAEATLQAQEQLLSFLQAQREEVSGVNIDEEMVDLTRHQQAFEAASRFINIVDELTSSLINIGS